MLLMGLRVVSLVVSLITLFCDNSGATTQSKELRSHWKVIHIERKCHLICDIVLKGNVAVKKILSTKNLANPFTKTSSSSVFNKS